ncbi:MAG: flagellar biosynthesis protein FlhF [Enterobacterales bacterium]|nr:flagellar biosynthesis protein FlhF [Enterobacterales bacterium]
MKIRRFYSKNMRNALRQVSEAFGDDAAILSSQKTASGVEVIAALDYDENLLPSSVAATPKHNPEGGLITNKEKKEGVQQNTTSGLVEPELFEKTLRAFNSELMPEGRTKTNNIANESDSFAGQFLQNENPLPASRATAESLVPDLVEWSTDPGLVAMREELGLMRSMMSEQLKGLGWERFTEKQPVKAMLTRRFSSLGISPAITSRLLPLVKNQQDVECSWQNFLALLAKSIKVGSDNLMEEGGIYAFMGPTGAGKTTTIAKIAARFAIKHGASSVALISADDYRISAPQRLSNFAKLLDIPMVSVSAKRPINHLLNHFRHKKLILIDTAGYSKKDQAIAKQLDSLQHTGRNIKRFLLMPATNQLMVLKESLKLFQRYSPYSVIVTKLDEATSLGEVLSLVIENEIAVSFTTDGQRVPEDMRQARNHHLVSKAVWLTNKFGSNPEEWQLAQDQQVKYHKIDQFTSS